MISNRSTAATDLVRGHCLRHLARLDTLRVTANGTDWRTEGSRIIHVLNGVVALHGTLRRLELRGHVPKDLTCLATLPQLEVLLVDAGRHLTEAKNPTILPSPMPCLRALALPRRASPPWPAYPVLEEFKYEGVGRLSPTFSAHMGECATASKAALRGGRLGWLSLASYSWLPVGTVVRLLAAHPSLSVVEVGANAVVAREPRDTARWRIDARHLSACLAEWRGHKMAEIATADIGQWAASSPAVVVRSLLDF